MHSEWPLPRIVRQELTSLAVILAVNPNLLFINFDTKARGGRNTPFRTVGDRQRLGQNIILHHLGGLLIALDNIWQSQERVMRGSRGNAELSVRVFANLETLERCDASDSLKLQ
jgi:hypothetical protein